MKSYIIIFCLIINLPVKTAEYVKYFFEDGSIKAEGWVNGDQKENYWYFYYPNQKMKAKGSYKQNKKEGYWYYFNEKGSTEMEGHYKEGIATSWWRYYVGDSVMTVELQDGKREGLALYKVNGKPVKAEYYFNDERTHEWFSLQEYRNDKADLNHLENQ